MSVDGALDYPGPYRMPAPLSRTAPGGAKLFDGDGPGFSDLLDVINPLQHLPVIGTVYRGTTGDELGGLSRLLGGLLFGGLPGLIVAAGNLFVEAISGRDIGGHFTAAFLGPASATLGEEGRLEDWWPSARLDVRPATDHQEEAVRAYRRVAQLVQEPQERAPLDVAA